MLPDGEESGARTSCRDAVVNLENEQRQAQHLTVGTTPGCEEEMSSNDVAILTICQTGDHDNRVPLFSLAKDRPNDMLDHIENSAGTEESFRDASDDDNWEPLAPLHANNSKTDVDTVANETDFDTPIPNAQTKINATAQEVMHRNTSKILDGKKDDSDGNNMLLWIGGGVAIARAVVWGLVLAANRNTNDDKKSCPFDCLTRTTHLHIALISSLLPLLQSSVGCTR
ncbi:hypothetical protein ACHAWX_001647 [Stephanocyclus meneghinianus]